MGLDFGVYKNKFADNQSMSTIAQAIENWLESIDTGLVFNQLKVKHLHGFYVVTISVPPIVNYPEEHRSSWSELDRVHPYSGTDGVSGVGQSFITPVGTTPTLNTITFYMCISSGHTPTGSLVARLYAHSGAYGVTSIPDETQVLAESDEVDIATTLTSSYALVPFTFSGDQQYEMVGNTEYCIAVIVDSGTVSPSSKRMQVGNDAIAPYHGGNASLFLQSIWIPYKRRDLIFYVGST